MKDRLKVGAAKVCINPTADMYPVAGTMSDFGLEPMKQMEPYDDMNCRAIAIDSGKTKALLLTFELSGAPDFPNYPEAISRATGFPDDMIFIMGTHNHSAPRYRKGRGDPEVDSWAEKYEKIIYDAGINVCQRAVESMRLAKYGYGETLSYINVNRNQFTFGGYWVEGRNLEGYSDKTLSIMKFVDLDGNLIAAFLNHATHATNIYMLKDIDHKAKTSGNITGIACRFVEEHYGNGAVAMWTSGAAGDQNPLMSHGLQYEYPDGYTTQVQYPDGTGYMQMEYMGRWHGVDCCRGIDHITRYQDVLPITHVEKAIPLPTRKCVELWPPKDFSIVRSGGQGVRDYEKNPYGQLPAPGIVPEMVPDQNSRILNLHLLKVGNEVMLFANGEIFSGIGKAMKEASPFRHTVIVTHHYGQKCNYIFDKSSVDVLLPMAYGAVIPGEADDLIVEGELDLFDQVLNIE